MPQTGSLVELGERYWALGLSAAARSAFARALDASPTGDAIAARRLAEVALAVGDTAAARRYAAEVVKREPGPAARVLLGQAQLAAGESGAARMSLAAALDTPDPSRIQHARAHLGLGQAAAATADRGGAAANVMAALDMLLAAVTRKDVELAELAATVDAEVALAEEIFANAVAFGRGADAVIAIDEAAARRPDAPLGLLRALLGIARHSQGDRAAPEVSDADVDAALRAEIERRPGSRVVQLRIVERQLRRRYHDTAARAGAVAELERMATELADDTQHGSSVERARVWFLLAAAYEDDPATAGRAEDAYRRGLTLRPGHAVAACRLALLMLERGDTDGALAEIERALRIDAGFGLAWRNAARMLDAANPALNEVVGRLLDAAYPGAGAASSVVAPRLLAAAAEVARGDILAGVHAHGHRVKNVLGIIGSRTRSARKLAGDGELSDKLRDLEREVTALYEEWAQYLRSMQAAGPTLEVVAVAPLVHDVVNAATAKSTTPIELSIASSLPDLRGDRMLLREALLNVVNNAVEACVSGGQVTVTARPVPSGGAPAIEVVVADTGPGIPRSELGRIFVPGYTTKETGSGVGLAIAERVVAAHHGRILVDSEETTGTTVTVILPTDLGGFATLGNLGPRGDGGAV